jgi:dCMP deaminase
VNQIKEFSNQTAADLYYLSQAFIERKATDDPKGKIVLQSAVGAVIAERSKEIVRSANILPPGIRDSFRNTNQEIIEEDRYFLIEHAERAAIFKAFHSHADLSKSTIYCTRFPCSDCARAIVWAGIKRAVFPEGFAKEKRWLASQRAALRILREGGVVVRYLSVTV